MNPNQRFAELAGIHWHEYYVRSTFNPITGSQTFYCECGEDVSKNPDFTDAREVLKVMREKEDWKVFLSKIRCDAMSIWDDVVPVDLILDTTGQLRDLAIEWMEKEAKHD
jgi:hypothetical protein